MNKQMRTMLISVGIVFSIIFIYKALHTFLLNRFLSSQSERITVSTMNVSYASWQPKLNASGSLRAVRGVNVTTEAAGIVQTIYFTPGAAVKENAVLVQINADNDLALLHSLEANAELAKITYQRDKAQYAIRAISKQTLDADAAHLKSLRAQVAQQAAIVAQKTIVAPFAGRLGISAINPGQYLNPGDKVVTLQTFDPIYVDFYMPQQTLAQLKVGQVVTVTSDTFPGELFIGNITTIDSAVDSNTRNVEVEATLVNHQNKLTPGMFTSVEIETGKPQRYLTLPQTAISFNPYGEIVYVVRMSEKDRNGRPVLTATQAFVTTGETRGDQIVILKGLKEGETVVTSGQLKLKNGSRVEINNTGAVS